MSGCHVPLGPDSWFWLDIHPLGPWNHLEGMAFSQSSSEEGAPSGQEPGCVGFPAYALGSKGGTLPLTLRMGIFGCGLILGERMTFVPEAECLDQNQIKHWTEPGVRGQG